MSEPVFPAEEFEQRTARAQRLMAKAGLEALLLTTEPDVRYFSGFLTRFWESPTRPWFMVVPAVGKPVAVIPSIGVALMQTTWIDDIRSWRAPDYTDDGVSLLADTLVELTGPTARIGLPMSRETHVRMPLADLERLRGSIDTRALVDDSDIIRRLRQVKSEAEIAVIAQACAVASRAFDRVPEIAQEGVPLFEVFRRFQMLCLMEGADYIPYLAGGAGPDGYKDVISPASDAPLKRGDVLMLDTGLTVLGYYCDFDRNFSIGPPAQRVMDAHARLIDATEAAFEIAKPGQRACDLFAAMDSVCTGGKGGSDAGRLGHGVGMQLTEPPSLIAADETVLEPGMVLTLEPGVDLGDGRIMVHEENIVIGEAGAEWLSLPSDHDIVVIGG